ncbi:hypothetical protein [Candidatus Marinarcus aquaticus]|uniref:Outer membrane lipoprotein carrier protein LolA n=1 Tax=Candidatus Marinarcus aquaticus TaxID=2044504 RepID=A0A4Q0XUL5_9BACT|nr:hypothetical protein [Candidatus Marinarcus aquaticus]RXJ57873.1 hypothetical protein CRV04_05035 [Candidatus Marinarcus aquaticus]
MFKALLIYIFLLQALYAQTIAFKEERFFQALNNSVYKTGVITFEKKSIQLQYDNSPQIFIFKNNQLIETSTNTIIKNQASIIYFTILQALFNEDSTTLKYYFTLDKKEKIHLLIPKEQIRNSIDKIEYEKKEHQLQQLRVILKNSDRIVIEPLY